MPIVSERAADRGTAHPAFRAYLFFSAFICGAAVMMVEVLGARLVGPFFGVSLFVWTALITVTLVALATGYALGGILADRRGDPRWLFGLILVAGLLVLAVPTLKLPVLSSVAALGLRWGALTGALLLFGPTLFLLGCVSPYLVRIMAAEMPSLGRTVGGLYALSTVGSFVGTLATGFYLVAWMGVDRIFVLTGGMLVVLGAGYFVLFRRRWAPLAACLAVAAAWPGGELPTARMADGTQVQVVASRDSFYGSAKVVEYRGGRLTTRELIIDGLVQGGVDTASGLSVYEYPYVLQYLPLALHPQARSALVIGLGAGVVPRFFAARGLDVDVVDIDPEIVALTRRHFGLPERVGVFVDDARYFLAKGGRQYDVVVLDVFGGDTTPGHLLSVEALRLLAGRMAAGGIVSVNMIGTVREETYMTASVVRTLGEVFDHVRVHPVAEEADSGNLIVVAWNGGARSADPQLLADLPIHPLAAGARAALVRTFAFPPGTPAMLLTDDYNPIDVLDVRLKEQLRKSIIDNTPAHILLSGAAAGRTG